MPSLSPCCVVGEIHTGTPRGVVRKVHGLTTYVAVPASGADGREATPIGTVVIIPDGFGYASTNTRILADTYATGGPFTVYVPDVQGGWGMPQSAYVSFTVIEEAQSGTWAGWLRWWAHWMRTMVWLIPFDYFARESVAWPRILDFVRAVRREEGAEGGVGVAGFCWGGRWSTLLCREVMSGEGVEKGLVDCAFAAHPSGLRVPEDVRGIKPPLTIAAAEEDEQLDEQKRSVLKAILKDSAAEDDKRHELVVYEGTTHGFAVRGSETVQKESEQGLAAEKHAISWFQRWFEACNASERLERD